MKLEDLRDWHKGETLWVLGSGPTLNFISPEFFADKIIVSTNFSARALGVEPEYVFTHYHQVAQDLLDDSHLVVTLARNFANNDPFPDADNRRIILAEQDSYAPPGSAWNPFSSHPPRADSLAYGSSSLHGSMHLAAHLGARFIMLVGADCGSLDDAERVEGYPPGDNPWALYDRHHKLMKDWLVENYGVNVYSLNPFINFNLEGHRFTGV